MALWPPASNGVWPTAFPEVRLASGTGLGLRGIAATVGRTPLVDLAPLSPRPDVGLAAKCEWFNPGGSVKDRPALWMIRDGLARGALRSGMTILDATSGNTGIGYALVGAALGYRVELCVPANASPERKRTLEAYGVSLHLTDPLEGTDGAIREARRLAEARPERYFYSDQYSNPANWRAHYATTGVEILDQTGGLVTHFVAGLGTSGTLMGVGRRLKEVVPGVRLVGVQPDGPLHGLEGLKHMASAMVPAIYDPSLVDVQLAARTEDAYAMCRRTARELGLWIGVSAGAVLEAAIRVASELDQGLVVALLADGGARYAGEAFWTGPSS